MQSDDGALSKVPYGGVGIFSPNVTECPENWAPYSDGQGRAIVPGAHGLSPALPPRETRRPPAIQATFLLVGHP